MPASCGVVTSAATKRSRFAQVFIARSFAARHKNSASPAMCVACCLLCLTLQILQREANEPFCANVLISDPQGHPARQGVRRGYNTLPTKAAKHRNIVLPGDNGKKD